MRISFQITLITLVILMELACLKPGCMVPMAKSGRDEKAWMGIPMGDNTKWNKPKSFEDFSHSKLYLTPLDLGILDCTQCLEFKRKIFGNIDEVFKNAIEHEFDGSNLVLNPIDSDYILDGKLMSVDKDSLGWRLTKFFFAPFSGRDNCIWWFKISNTKTGVAVLAYQLNALGPQDENIKRSFDSMAVDFRKAAERAQHAIPVGKSRSPEPESSTGSGR